jgi:DNA modification methylase
MSNNIIKGDARELLSTIRPVHMVFTDPPFDISNNRNTKIHKGFSGYTSNKGSWDEYVPAEEWVPDACAQLVRGGIFACFGTFGSLVPIFNVLTSKGMALYFDEQMSFQSHIVWHKTNPAPSVHRRMLTHANEFILVFSKGPKWYFDYDYSKTLNNGKQKHNVFDWPAVKKVLGVTRKPPELCEQLVRLFCPPAGIVLDPFAGSGAILEGAKRAERQYIGIEKRQDCVAYMRKELKKIK